MYKPIILVLVLLIIWWYIRNFEQKSIYYPTREIEVNPKAIGLEYEDIYFLSSDGVTLHAWYVKGEDAKYTVLFCHGNAGNISHRLELIDILNNLNLDVFIFDYRGYGRSRGTPNEKGVYKDALSGYNYLVKNLKIDSDKILVFGRSLGAAVAVDLATKVKIKALIIEAAFTSIVEMGKMLYPYLPVKFLISSRFDNLSKIDLVNVPKLFIHSKDDEIIPFSHGERLFKKAKFPKEFYQIRGSHNEGFLINKEEYKKRIKRFIEGLKKE